MYTLANRDTIPIIRIDNPAYRYKSNSTKILARTNNSVVCIKSLHNGDSCAVKFIRRLIDNSNYNHIDMQITLMKDTSISALLSHDTILSARNIVTYDADSISIEYDLAAFDLGDKRFIDVFHNRPKRYLLQMIDAVYYVHNMGFMHGDIKPVNFLYFPDGDIVKLTDYGLVRRTGFTHNIGLISYTLFYRPPEITYYKAYNESADVWALGISFYYLYVQSYESLYSIHDYTEDGVPLIEVGYVMDKLAYYSNIRNDLCNIDPDISTLILSMIEWEAHKRPQLYDVLQYDMFDGIDNRDIPKPNIYTHKVAKKTVSFMAMHDEYMAVLIAKLITSNIAYNRHYLMYTIMKWIAMVSTFDDQSRNLNNYFAALILLFTYDSTEICDKVLRSLPFVDKVPWVNDYITNNEYGSHITYIFNVAAAYGFAIEYDTPFDLTIAMLSDACKTDCDDIKSHPLYGDYNKLIEHLIVETTLIYIYMLCNGTCYGVDPIVLAADVYKKVIDQEYIVPELQLQGYNRYNKHRREHYKLN